MRRKPYIAIAAGAFLYLVLISVSYLSAQSPDTDGTYQDGLIESVASLLAWFLPALVAGSLTRDKPIFVGSILGLLMVTFDFCVTAIAFGWEWAMALLGVFPGSQMFLLVSAIAFAYAGWRIRVLNVRASSRNVA